VPLALKVVRVEVPEGLGEGDVRLAVERDELLKFMAEELGRPLLKILALDKLAEGSELTGQDIVELGRQHQHLRRFKGGWWSSYGRRGRPCRSMGKRLPYEIKACE